MARSTATICSAPSSARRDASASRSRSRCGSRRTRRACARCSRTSRPSTRARARPRAIIAAGILPAALEMMDGPTIRAVEASIYAAGYPADADAVLLIELDGLRRGARRATCARVEPHLPSRRRAHGARRARTKPSARGSGRGARRRSARWVASRRDLVVQDAVIPRTKLPDVLREIARDRRAHGRSRCATSSTRATATCIRTSATTRAIRTSRAAWALAMRDIMRACIDAGGTITGEHGIGLDKLRVHAADLLAGVARGAVRAARRVRSRSVARIPGKVVPVHSCREWMARVSTAAVQERVRASGATRARDRSAPRRDDRGSSPAALARRRPAGARRRAALARRRPTRSWSTSPGDLTLTARAGATLARDRARRRAPSGSGSRSIRLARSRRHARRDRSLPPPPVRSRTRSARRATSCSESKW